MAEESDSEETSEAQKKSPQAQRRRGALDLRRATGGGVTAMVFGLVFTLGVGGVAPYEVPALIRPLIATCQYWYSALMTVSATVVALMLTALSLSAQTDLKLSEYHYRRLRTIARLATIVFIASTLMLLLIGLPFENADAIPRQYFSYIYYAVAGTASVICGLMVTTVLLLYRSVSETITIVGMPVDDDHPLLRDDEE